MGAVCIPLAALLRPAAEADTTHAPAFIRPLDLRFLLGDQHDRDAAWDDRWAQRSCVLVTPRGGPYPHTDAGVEVRRLLHKIRSLTIETFNAQFKGISKSRHAAWSPPSALPLAPSLLHRYQQGADLRLGLKPFLKAA